MARFLVSHRLSGQPADNGRLRSRALFEDTIPEFQDFSTTLAAGASTVDHGRHVRLVEGDARDFHSKKAELHSNIIIEPECCRLPALFRPLRALQSAPIFAGIGAAVEAEITSNQAPLANVQVSLFVTGSQGSSAVSGITDADGHVLLPYDPRQWSAFALICTPSSGAWSWMVRQITPTMRLDLPPLPKTGPLGWHHAMLGISAFSETAGANVRVAVADTGVGPHPYLAHVESAGAFVNLESQTGPGALGDTAQHGTHVCGIIGARPAAGTGDFGGIAPGANLIAARVYLGGGPPTEPSGTASSGDISLAIDALSTTHRADIINLSLGSAEQSEIEADAIASAIEHGALVVCAAGNSNGGPVMFPAAYAQSVGISALGLLGVAPDGSLDASTFPSDPRRFTAGGLYVPQFVNLGPEIRCTCPGAAIISTVPGAVPLYAVMSGTSMATPAVCGALATVLSQDAAYLALPRGVERASRAWQALASTLRDLGLASQFQGFGLPAGF